MSHTLEPATAEPTGEQPSPVARQGTRVLERRRRRVAYGLLAPGSLYLLLTFVAPLFLVVYTSLQSGGLLSGGGFRYTGEFSNYPEAMGDYGTFFVRSIVYAGIATGASILIAYPMAYWIAFRGGRNKSTYLFLILLPFFVSFVIRTASWKFILNDEGFVLGPLKEAGLLPADFHLLATTTAVLGGLTYNYLPFMVLPLYASLERIDKRMLEAGYDLYGRRRDVFLRVTLPLSMPGVVAGTLLTFIPAAGDYINSQLLGSPNTTMIGQVVAGQFLRVLDYPTAAALSVVLMLTIVTMVTLYVRRTGTEELL